MLNSTALSELTRQPRTVNCRRCNKEYITRGRLGYCSEKCKKAVYRARKLMPGSIAKSLKREYDTKHAAIVLTIKTMDNKTHVYLLPAWTDLTHIHSFFIGLDEA